MRALSIWQPWATLIAIGAKHLETRPWDTSYRGPIAIHAAAKWNRHLCSLCVMHPFQPYLFNAGYAVHEYFLGYRGTLNRFNLPFGCIVAVAELADCRQTSGVGRSPAPWVHNLPSNELVFGDYSTGRYAWDLRVVRRLMVPVATAGRMGLWKLPPEICEAVSDRAA